MPAPDFEIGHIQAPALHRRQRLRQGRRVTARENVFANPWIGAGRRAHGADGMQQHHAAVGQQLARPREELAVVAAADMLEHTDRDDAIIHAPLPAIVAQMEPHPPGEPGARGPLVREFVLLLGERDAVHLAIIPPGQKQSHAAPAAADVEHPQAGAIQQQFGGDVILLVALRLLQRVVVMAKIRAGIMPLLVQEQLVEGIGKIVMMRRVFARAGRRIERTQMTQRRFKPPQQTEQGEAIQISGIPPRQREEIMQRAFVHRQQAFHVQFPGREHRAQQQTPLGHAAMQGDTDRRAAAPHAVAPHAIAPHAITIAACNPPGVGDGQAAATQKPAEKAM